MWFRWITNKVFGMFQQKYNKSWNVLLMYILRNGKVILLDEHTISFKLDDKIYEVWVANKFYAYGYLYKLDSEYIEDDLKFRPSYRVTNKLYKLEKEMRTKSVMDKINRIYEEKK